MLNPILMRRVAQPAVLALAGGLLALGACGDSTETDADRRAAAGLSGKVEAEHIEPFTPEELPDITGNREHELHFAGGVVCGECHLSTAPLPIDHAHEVCKDCHAERTVAAPVWENHCLSCHYFTREAQAASDDPQRMMDHLCVKCHAGDDFGGNIYGHCKTGVDEMVRCDHCHRPHDSAAPAAIELCVTCHHELTEVRHPQGSDVKCSLCHAAHLPPPTGGSVCTVCHGQAEQVLVHRIPAHPADCLVCHEPHFTTPEIKRCCEDCHEEYQGIVCEGQPQQHLDCENCHVLDDFSFRGSGACGRCHAGQGVALAAEGVPEQHQRCITCHPPHSWFTSFRRTCQRCHELDSVFEHQLEFHPDDCGACHDPHGVATMPKSGSCGACHQGDDNLPSFGANPPEMHLSCANCHEVEPMRQGRFRFIGQESTCLLCHFEAADGLGWDDTPSGHQSCDVCHSPHDFGSVAIKDSCQICHADAADAAPNDLHRDCLLCHEPDHAFAFAGQEASCQLCHSDAATDAPNQLHADCANCHAFDHGFAFSGIEKSCELCHGDVVDQAPSELHEGCDTCHAQDHSVEYVGADGSCSLCHPDLPAEHRSPGHAECSYCHASHTFAAHYDACTVCHTDREDHFAGYQCSRCHKFGPGGVYKEHGDVD